MNVQSFTPISPRPYSCSPEEAFLKFGNMVYRLAFVRTKSRTDADDVLQDVFIRLMHHQHDFQSEEHLKAWLLRATINRSISLLTSAHRRRNVPLEDSIPVHMKESSPVWEAVQKLPQKYRTVIHLYYYEDYSLNEISEILGIKETTLRSQLFRARDILKNELKGAFD